MREAPKKIPNEKTKWSLRTLAVVLLMPVWVVASTIASQLIIGYLLLFTIGKEQMSQSVWQAVYSALVYVLALVFIILLPCRLAKRKKRNKSLLIVGRDELGLRGSPTWTDIGLAPVGFIVYLLLASGIVALFSLFPWFNAAETQDILFSTYAVGFDRIVAFVTLVVVAPIAEEVIFRGWLYGRLKKVFVGKVSDLWAMIISIFLVSLTFGIVHLQWNVGVNVFAMSIVLCGLREITGTIYAGILLHMLKNGVAFYLLYVLGM